MADLHNFDPAAYPSNRSFPPLPEGEYIAEIVESLAKTNSQRTGTYIQLKLRVIEGPYRGRFVWDRLHRSNPNHDAVRISNTRLAEICRAFDVPRPRDTEEFHHRPIRVRIRCVKRKDNGEIVNEVGGYKKHMPSPPGIAAVPGTSAPWMR